MTKVSDSYVTVLRLMYPDASTTEIRDALSKSNNSISMSKPILERLGHVNKKQTGKAPPAEKTAYGARVNYVPCYIQTTTTSGKTATPSGETATTSGKTATTSGKTATTSGKTATTSGKTATASGKTATTNGKTTARTVKTTPPVVKTAPQAEKVNIDARTQNVRRHNEKVFFIVKKAPPAANIAPSSGHVIPKRSIGPNPLLRHGPNKSLVNGPNKLNCKGPQVCLAQVRMISVVVVSASSFSRKETGRLCIGQST